MSSMFAFDGSGSLNKLDLQLYEKEAHLQDLIARYPQLLVGDLGSIDDSPRWMLVKREFKVPGVIDTGGRFSLDAVFLDQDGIPVLVEVKRASNTQIKREVVGQILDYAQGFLASVAPGTLRSLFLERCGSEQNAAKELNDHLLDGMSHDEFWEAVASNLRERKLQLVIVADEVPQELYRILDFLDEKMPSIEVFAVSIKQYANKETTTRFMLSEAKRLGGRLRPSPENTSSMELSAPKSTNWAELVTFNIDPGMQTILLEEAQTQRTSPSVRKIYYDADGAMRWRLKVQKSSVNMYQQMRFKDDYSIWKSMFPEIRIGTPASGSQLTFNMTRPEELRKFLDYVKSKAAGGLEFLPRGATGEIAPS